MLVLFGVANSLACPGRRSVRRVLADDLIGSYKLWLNIRRQGLQPVQRFLYFRTQYHHLGHQFFGASVIACGFQREQDTIQSSHGVFDLAQVHAESSIRIGDEAAFIQKIIELHRHAAGMRVL